MQPSNHKIILLASAVFIHLMCCMNFLYAQSNKNSPIGPPPGTYHILSGDEITIPFEYYKNKFRFKAQINGKDCQMMLDNGSLWDQLLFFGSPQVDKMGFKISGETNLGSNKADIAENISIRFKDVVFHGQTAVITRYDPNLPNPWEGFDGQISATFFKHFVVKIDFDQSFIELIPPDQFNYNGNGEIFKMKPGPFASRTMTAEMIMHDGKTITLDLLIDLGGFHPLYLPIGKDDRITLPTDAVETSLGKGLFSHKGYLGTIKEIRLGNFTLNDIPTAFTVVEKNANIYSNTMIGLPLLKKFNIIFDYFNERIILEPLKSFFEPFLK